MLETKTVSVSAAPVDEVDHSAVGQRLQFELAEGVRE